MRYDKLFGCYLLIWTTLFSSAALADTEELVARVEPAVVVIKTASRAIVTGRNGPHEIERKGAGTGVLVTPAGQVLTAAHVVQTADNILVEFVGGEKVGATVVAVDPFVDVALLQLDSVPAAARPVPLGDSDSLRKGEQVVVMGSPFDLGISISRGIVSGKHRTTKGFGDLGEAPPEIIQTDAAINKGNSGGPMFNSAGEVVGIVSFMLTQSGGFDGLGFAVAANTVRQTLFGNPMFWSGLESVLIQGAFAKALNIGGDAGFLVQKVAAGSVSDRLGIRPGKIPIKLGERELLIGGDVILEFEGIPVAKSNLAAIRHRMQTLRPGDSISVKITRQGVSMKLDGQLPAPGGQPAATR